MGTSEERRLSPETLAAQALHEVDPATGGIIPPLQFSTTYARDPEGALTLEGVSYARDLNPTGWPAEALLARLEGGAEALLFGSGMAAASAVFLALEPGARVVVPRVMYWGFRAWLRDFADRWGLEISVYDAADPSALERAVGDRPAAVVWVETPANPTWEVTDLAEAARLAHGVGARLAVDSTAPTPVHTRPIEFGADLVMHSASKGLNGHSDVLAGALVTAALDDRWARIREVRAGNGAVLGPMEAWLLLRGLRTLFVRQHRASASARRIAEALEGHARLSAVLYPGLASHPGHEIARRQMRDGFGSFLSIRLAGGEAAALKALGRLQVFYRATSLGGVESLAEHRASIEGPDSPVPADLLRLSIGLEDPDDLLADLRQAIEA